MIHIQQHTSLQSFNTFGVDVEADYFARFQSEEELIALLSSPEVSVDLSSDYAHQKKILLLGAGSNILLTKHVEGIVLKNEIGGIDIVHEDEDYVYVKAGAGVVWHEFVLYCVEHNLGGVENLSLIPGTVGATPIQNIGAYGVELKDTFHALRALDIETNEWVNFSSHDCAFGYRSSIFKTALKGRVIIASVTFKLTKKHQLHLAYGAIKERLTLMGIEDPSIKDVSDAVIAIRQSKLPDPRKIGNAGSFFKNPLVSAEVVEHLTQTFPDLVSNKSGDGYKLAAGWLIEKAGWKGYREGHVGCYEKQALVLVNYGGASGAEIVALSQKIQQSVLDTFGILLEPEVNFV
jgi:UDP-N-acetylmuramate dehydrogenase